jgi:hypothetical protein
MVCLTVALANSMNSKQSSRMVTVRSCAGAVNASSNCGGVGGGGGYPCANDLHSNSFNPVS